MAMIFSYSCSQSFARVDLPSAEEQLNSHIQKCIDELKSSCKKSSKSLCYERGVQVCINTAEGKLLANDLKTLSLNTQVLASYELMEKVTGGQLPKEVSEYLISMRETKARVEAIRIAASDVIPRFQKKYPLSEKLKQKKQQCSTVDMEAEGGSTHNVAINHQGQTYSCYAHAAAAGMTAAIQKISGDTSLQVSPLALAIRYHEGDWDKVEHKGGNGCCVLRNTNKNSRAICLRRAVAEKYGDKGQLQSIMASINFYTTRMEKFWKVYREATQDPSVSLNSSEKEELRSLASNLREEVQCLYRGSRGIFPDKFIPGVEWFENIILQFDSPYKVGRAIVLNACTQNQEAFFQLPSNKKITCNETGFLGKEGFQKSIHEYLDGGNQSLPLLMSYCSRVLYKTEESNYAGVIPTEDGGHKVITREQSSEDYCGRHLSTITGRRWNPKKAACEIKVTNTWGPECRQTYASDCENGSIYVSEDLLGQNIYELGRIGIETTDNTL